MTIKKYISNLNKTLGAVVSMDSSSPAKKTKKVFKKNNTTIRQKSSFKVSFCKFKSPNLLTSK